jgi:hypothetical protein
MAETRLDSGRANPLLCTGSQRSFLGPPPHPASDFKLRIQWKTRAYWSDMTGHSAHPTKQDGEGNVGSWGKHT